VDIRLVIFDMDGVIFEGKNFWLDLHRCFGTEQEGVNLAEKHIESDYILLANTVAGELWKGKSSGLYEKLIRERAYQPGIKKLLNFLHAKGILSAIVSTGPFDLAERARLELGINEIRANRLEIQKGILTGKVEVQVEESNKSKSGLEVMSALRVAPDKTACVGDSDSDADLAKVVSLTIAYDSRSEKLKTASTHVIRYGHIEDIIGILNLD